MIELPRETTYALGKSRQEFSFVWQFKRYAHCMDDWQYKGIVFSRILRHCEYDEDKYFDSMEPLTLDDAVGQFLQSDFYIVEPYEWY